MKVNKEMSIDFDKQTFIVRKTFHLYEHRTDNKFSRAEFLDDKRYLEIMKYALREGLTSFRNKRCVVTVRNFEGTYFSILCHLGWDNVIILISVFHKKYKFWKSFNRCQNRINIFRGYVVPKMSSKEHYKKQFEKVLVQRDLEDEDEYFKNAFRQNIRKIEGRK